MCKKLFRDLPEMSKKVIKKYRNRKDFGTFLVEISGIEPLTS